MVWLPIVKGYATLREIDEHWTLLDLLECHRLIDLQIELDRINGDEGA